MFGGAVDEPAGPEGLARPAGADREDKFRPPALGGVCVVGEKAIRWHVTSSFQVETRQKTPPRREQEMIAKEDREHEIDEPGSAVSGGLLHEGEGGYAVGTH